MRLSGISRDLTPISGDIVVTREPLADGLAAVWSRWSAPSNPSNTTLRENHSGPGYKSPREISTISPCSPHLSFSPINPLSQWYCMFRVLCMKYARGSDHPSCYQQSSVVLVNYANCGSDSCKCGERSVARRCARCVGRHADPSNPQLRMQAR